MITNGAAPRYAWYRRVSTEDEQDSTLSFPRQLANAQRQVAKAGGRIVGHYFDVESGTGGYAARGSGGVDRFQISISRDGGLRELLADATARRFDRVIVESISRLSRNSSVAFRIEDELRAAGVRLCAADEPAEESFGSIVLRHVNIGIARGYHHELMVKSRQGQEVSTRQGWHTAARCCTGTVRRARPSEPAQGPSWAAKAPPWNSTRCARRWCGRSTTGTGGRGRSDADPGPAQRRPGAVPAADAGRPGQGARRVELVECVGGAEQPEVHRPSGVEPAGPQEGQQPAQTA